MEPVQDNKTIDESDQAYSSVVSMPRSAATEDINRAVRRAPQSSSLGTVCCLIGTTHFLADTSNSYFYLYVFV